jgi:cytochrome c553
MKIGFPAASFVARAVGILALVGVTTTVVHAQDAPAAAAADATAAAAAPAPTPSGPAPRSLAGNVENGAAKAAVCGACHGINGNSVNPEWPNLAGQHHQYTVEQLHLFKGAVRTNAIMQAQAMPLSEQDMADLAAYFEQQTLTGLESDPSTVAIGQRLYKGGDAKRGIPACIACHGPNGLGVGPAMWPQVRSQHSLYTYNQLKNYATQQRYVVQQGQPAPPAQAQMMYDIAAKLTDAEMRALANYLQGLR